MIRRSEKQMKARVCCVCEKPATRMVSYGLHDQKMVVSVFACEVHSDELAETIKQRLISEGLCHAYCITIEGIPLESL
jgi:hypothetical protein